jgi:DNA-directed RNA polymerase subunit RPC12/RpoP
LTVVWPQQTKPQKKVQAFTIEPLESHRNSLLACPECGRRVLRFRFCDAEFKCKYCGCEFVVIVAVTSHLRSLGNSSANAERKAIDTKDLS